MYVPQWETLADALARVLATGLDGAQAKRQICAAIADREISVRVKIDKTERDMQRRCLSDRQVNPPHLLSPEDLDWVHSKPQAAWDTGPYGPESYAFMGQSWRTRRIAMLELWTEHVTGIFCLATDGVATVAVTAIGNTTRAEAAAKAPCVASAPVTAEDIRERAPERLRSANREVIRRTIKAVYSHAQRHGMKPPNVKEIIKPVQEILKRDGFYASANQVQSLASEDNFATFRRKPGPRVNRTFPPFSLEGWEKSGLES